MTPGEEAAINAKHDAERAAFYAAHGRGPSGEPLAETPRPRIDPAHVLPGDPFVIKVPEGVSAAEFMASLQAKARPALTPDQEKTRDFMREVGRLAHLSLFARGQAEAGTHIHALKELLKDVAKPDPVAVLEERIAVLEAQVKADAALRAATTPKPAGEKFAAFS